MGHRALWAGCSSQLGDDINVYLLERMTGRRVVVKNQSAFHNRFYRGPIYSCIGSIIGWYETPQTTVWGSGIIAGNVTVDILPKELMQYEES